MEFIRRFLTSIPQIDRLEQNCGQLQLNLSSAHQRHKQEVNQLEEHISKIDANLRQSQARGTALEQEIKRKEEHIRRNEAEIKSYRQDIASKADEVSYSRYLRE